MEIEKEFRVHKDHQELYGRKCVKSYPNYDTEGTLISTTEATYIQKRVDGDYLIYELVRVKEVPVGKD